jgi:ADP-heptose:LPS heptosyltransferase
MFLTNLYCLTFALCGLILKKKKRPSLTSNPRIAIIAPLLIGDSLMSISLIAKLRLIYPTSPISLICTEPLADLLRFGPYGIKTITIRVKSLKSVTAIRASGPFDLGYALGENRYAMMAKAIGCSTVVALAGGKPLWRNLFIDQAVLIDQSVTNIYTQQAQLAGDLDSLPSFSEEEFFPLNYANNRLTEEPYLLLHLGSSRQAKQLAAAHWRELINTLGGNGFRIVIAVGPGERDLIQPVDPTASHQHYVGSTNLSDFWGVVRHAAALVCVDSAAAHIGKLTGTFTICFYGPGGQALTGPDQFFPKRKFVGLTLRSLPDKCHEPVFKRALPARPAGETLSNEAAIAETVSILKSLRP